MSGWQPIETAPKNRGSEILILAEGGEMFVCYWNGENWQFGQVRDSTGVKTTLCVADPVTWMPLPELPND